ncbi:hypothetical protein [Occultella gossypii]|uniref:DUF3944 domain-containing protein n=1 Tax=Occultella gossypii TaxID=2800820 RepID=A0ABS7SBN1_9MICO|nr:hypothetical protein [Occultella gossypii]MBZ2197502.1 hypothetical protein [Occultella gossypii]
MRVEEPADARVNSPALEILANLDPSMLAHLGSTDGQALKKFLPLLPLLQDDELVQRLEASGYEGIDEFRRLAADFKSKTDSSTEQIRAITSKMFDDACGPELEAATKTKIVRLKPLMQADDDWSTDVLVRRFVAEITALLEDGGRHMLLDSPTSKFAGALIDEKRMQPSSLAIPNARESIVGTEIIALLPTVGDTPVDELLDLRWDLIGPLSNYRRTVASLGEKMRVGPLDREADAEVDHIYRVEVVPAIQQMREHLTEHSLVREVGRAVGADLKSVVLGAAAIPALVVGAQFAANLATAATAGLAALPGVAGATSVLMRARAAQKTSLIKRPWPRPLLSP